MNAFARSIVLASVLALAAGMAPAAGPPAGPSTSAGPGGWPPLPPGTRTILLLTGADLGHWEPRKCFNNFGGILYRLGLNEWLFDHEPGIDWHWVSAGDVLSLTLENTAVRPPREIYEGLARIGYDVVGVGYRDLQLLGPFAIRALTRDLPLHLVATNLRVLETGRPFLEESAVLETASGRIGVLVLLPYREDAAWVSPEYGTVTIEPPGRHLVPALRRLASRAGRVVLVAQLDPMTIGRLLESLPPDVRPPDLVVGERGTYGQTDVRDVGGVPLLWVGGYGQYLGRAALDARGKLLEVRGMLVRGTFPIDPRTGRPVAPGAALPRRDH